MLQFAECWIYCIQHIPKTENVTIKRTRKEKKKFVQLLAAAELGARIWVIPLRRVKILTATRTHISWTGQHWCHFCVRCSILLDILLRYCTHDQIYFYRNGLMAHNFKRMWELKIIDKWCWWIHSFSPRVHSLTQQSTRIHITDVSDCCKQWKRVGRSLC